jgi:hypothetical protein
MYALVNYAHRIERSFDSTLFLISLESFPEIYNSLNFYSIISATEKLLVSKPPNNVTREESNLEDNLYTVSWNLEACAEKIARHFQSARGNPHFCINMGRLHPRKYTG